MDIVAVRRLCLSKEGATEDFPFGDHTLVFKVGGKMFALCSLDDTPFRLNLKCDPERALELREEFPQEITGAYHMNKKHWNSLLPEHLPEYLLKELVNHSYDLVLMGLPKKFRDQLSGKAGMG